MVLHKTALVLLLALVPLQAAIVLRSELTLERAAAPGEQYAGSIEISNSAAAPQRVHIYKTDFRSTAEGESIYNTPNGTGRSNAGWIDYSPEHATLPAHGVLTIPYTVQVPPQDSLDGSYWCVLMIEPEDDIIPLQQVNTLQIHSRIRYAVKVVTNVHTGRRQLDFLESRVLERDGETLLQVDAGNSGTAAFKAVLTLQLFDSAGQNAGTFTAPYQSLYPGSARRFEIGLPHELSGKFKALLTADCGEEALFGITFTLDMDEPVHPDRPNGSVTSTHESHGK
ncbi:MAG TPA: hypothetical protein PKI62_13200 [bacterium]|nr:hypothetical protein [bacterium]HPR89094.1 hypothetical protein [bacterium]